MIFLSETLKYGHFGISKFRDGLMFRPSPIAPSSSTYIYFIVCCICYYTLNCLFRMFCLELYLCPFDSIDQMTSLAELSQGNGLMPNRWTR